MSRRPLITLAVIAIVLATWTNLRTATQLSSSHSGIEEEAFVPHYKNKNNATLKTKPVKLTNRSNTSTKILGFADGAYQEYALRWYHRLESLGYREQVIVAVDQKAADFFKAHHPDIRWEELPYKPCVTWEQDARTYRRQLFGRRWKYVLDQLNQGHSVLLTDVDNVFFRYLPMKELEESKFDVFHAFSTAYPVYVFESMGFTVCGGMAWLRAHPRVIRFVGSLVNKCKCLKEEDLCKNCYCDDQVALNEMLWKGKHKVTWDRTIPKPASQKDFQWKSLTGISTTTKHRVKIWDRNFAFRAPMPDNCPPNNWVSMPLYVNRSDVVQVWDKLCSKNE
jgi:hypothetical protein